MNHHGSSDNQSPSPSPVSPKPTGPIIVVDDSNRRRKRKPTQANDSKPQPKREPKNLFSDDTARLLIRFLKGKKELPKILPGLRPDQLKSKPSGEPTSRDLQEELAAAIRGKLRPWLWSILLHGCLLIALALVFFPAKARQNPFEIILGLGQDEKEIVKDALLGNAENTLPTIITPRDLPEVERPKPDIPKTEVVETATDTVPSIADHRSVTLSLSCRDFGSRPVQLGGSGGTGQTDAAVMAGLRWLAKVQMRDGSWSLSGPYRDGAIRSRENRIAATAMALLAFQGYGVTPKTTHPELIDFSKAVRNGWEWLLRQQHPGDNPIKGGGAFFRDGMVNSHRFYTHGMCTIAICELFAMTGDESFREPAQRAVHYCVQHQSLDGGGWRYDADRWNADSDVSVTGWIVLALKSAQTAGLRVPEEVFERVSRFLDAMGRDDGSQYVYREREPEIRISMTAEALLCRELLGWKRDDPRLIRGVRLLIDLENLPRFDDHYRRDAYGWYYATQTLHHYGGEPWKIWNERMREELPRHQEQKGAEAGSWHPKEPVRDKWGHQFGRLYTTCLSIYMLEVYYRHLRIYR